MSLVERLEKCRVELDREIRAKVAIRTYDYAAADMRQVIEDAKKRIEELESCQQN
jgi:ribosomal protein L20